MLEVYQLSTSLVRLLTKFRFRLLLAQYLYLLDYKGHGYNSPVSLIRLETPEIIDQRVVYLGWKS